MQNSVYIHLTERMLVRCFFNVSMYVALCCLAGSAGQSISLSSNVTFNDDTALCPGTLVEFECVGINLEVLELQVLGQSGQNPIAAVRYSVDINGHLLSDSPSQPPGYSFSLPSFDTNTGQNPVTANFTAILSVELSALASGEQIECFRGQSLSQTINITYSSRNAPSPSMFTTNFTRGQSSPLNLNFYWNESFTRAHAVEMYCISSDGVDCSTCVSPNTTFVCPQIMQGQATSFSVRAVNCGSQQGEPVNFTVNPQVPGQTSTCSSVPVYSSKPAGDLIGIKNTWRLVPSPSVFNPDKLNYTLSVNATNDLFMEEIVVTQKEVCLPSTNQCEYVTYLSESREAQLQTIAVTVTAENVVGRGEPQPCSPTISTKNRIFETTVVRDDSRTLVQCQFIIPTKGAMQTIEECMFCYGDIAQSCEQQSLMCLPPIVVQDDRTGIASYELPQEFCYQITASVDGNTTAVVSGRVEVDCNTTDLGGSTVVSPPSDERCLDINAVGSVLIENGVICYNGTSTGSLVTYHCNSGYQLKDGDGMRRCQSDSNWDGQMATCSQEPCLNAARFFFAVAVVVSVVTILFSSCMIYKIRSNTDKRLYIAGTTLGTAMLCVLLVIIFYASMEALQQNQALCVISNLVSIVSAIACIIFSTLTGIMYIYDISEHDNLPKPTGATLGKSFRDSKAFGKRPSIAVNNHSVVVEVYEEWWYFERRTRKLQYRVGQLANNGIKWIGKLQNYSEGQRPRVAINDNNVVVAVRESPSRDRCFYCVGSVKQATGEIEWVREKEFANGCCPDVAITDSKVILSCCENATSNSKCYTVVRNIDSDSGGEAKASGRNEEKRTFPFNASQLSIAVNSAGTVIAAYQASGSICCIAGTLSEDGDIKWLSERPQTLVKSAVGVSPVVSINSQGYVVVVLYLGNILHCKVGYTFNNSTNIEFLMERSASEYIYGYGRHPAVSIDDKNNIVEIHETDAYTTKLYYHFGMLCVKEENINKTQA